MYAACSRNSQVRDHWHSSDLSHSGGNIGFLTHWATRKLPESLLIMCLSEDLFELILLVVHWVFILMCFIRFGKFLAITSSNTLSAPFLLSSPPGTPPMCLQVLMKSGRSLRFCSLFSIFFSCSSDLIISFVLSSNSWILSSACSNLPLNYSSDFFLFVLIIGLFSSRICFWFPFRFSISLLIFHPN